LPAATGFVERCVQPARRAAAPMLLSDDEPRRATLNDTVRLDIAGAVATVTLNRPEARNALTAEMKDALLAALRRCGSDADIRAAVLTGAGQAFCAGQDLREHASLLESGAAPTDTVRLHYNPIITAITSMPKPVIAAVNGSAAGAGAGLAFACDFRIAGAGSSLLMAFARVGLGADSGTSWTLQRLAGLATATELLMLAEPVNAERALALGLVTSVVPDAELTTAARELAARLAAGPTVAYGAIKASLAFAAAHDLVTSLEKEAQLQAMCATTEDHRDATRAFVQKQQPTFLGR
jgi:2-(1,2-epoxy-1,2-dihydrophenyl)acetyl-CoA isomerase